jgi:hypothetical protein
MAEADTETSDKRLYLDDLAVGHFTSRPHVVDASEIKAFARPFAWPQPRATTPLQRDAAQSA